MCDTAAQERFLQANTFYCEKLKARITHRQCELNRQKPRISEAVPDKRPFGFTTNKTHDYMPFACEGCQGPKEEKAMPICSVEGCGKKATGRGLCSTHYMQERTRAQKEGTWNTAATHPKAKEKTATKSTEPTRKPATPREFHGLPEEPIQVLPHKGKLYLLAEIRVMTEEKLREMFGG